jgi:hypothetical protein
LTVPYPNIVPAGGATAEPTVPPGESKLILISPVGLTATRTV